MKVLAGDLASPEARERFRIERRLLACLEHRSIARLLDGGVTDDGRPYFAMEYVEGERLDRATEGMGLDGRLALFEEIADAVRYAHTHMVIHRDLKPANVLVTRDGAPRLLDFGIAKLLGETDDGPTHAGDRPLTPQYAAPEQVRGGEISQATDVHGLGLLLYEMVTGSRPYRVGSSRAEMERAVCETRPTLPSEAAAADAKASRWAPRLRGDLDHVVCTAISKDPADRYSSVERLIEDVRRFRARRPLLARPRTAGYTLSMFLRRNPVASGAAAAACVAVVGGLVFVGAAYQRAATAVRSEREQRVVAEQIGLFLDDMLSTIDPVNAQGRDTALLKEVLDRAHDRLRDGAIASDAVRAPLEHRVGAVYAAIGSTERATDHLVTAERLWEELGREDSPEYASTLFELSLIDVREGRFEALEARLHRAIEIRRRAFGERAPSVGQALDALGAAMIEQGRLGDAGGVLEEASGILSEHFAPGSDDLLQNINKRVIVLTQGGDDAGALEILRPHAEAVTGRTAPTPAVAVTLNTMAVLTSRSGDHEEAQRWYARNIDVCEDLYGPTHSSTLTARSNAAVAKDRAGLNAEAEADYRTVLAVQEGALGPDHPDTITSRLNLGVLLVRMERLAEAEPFLRRIVDDASRVLGAGHPVTSIARAALGEALIGLGDAASIGEAERLIERAIEDLEKTLGPGSGPTKRMRRVLAEARGERDGADE